MHRGPSPETAPLLRRNFCLMCAGFAAACLFIAGLLTSASLQGQARKVWILPVFSSSVAFQKNLRTSSKKFLGTGRAAADSKLFLGRICAIADSDRRYVRISFHLRPVFLERVSESPGRRPSRTSPSIQAALSDSHIDYFCPRGADFREEGVLRSKARVAHVSAGPRVPLLRRPARCREASLMSLARMQVERGSPYPSRACSPLAVYRVARLPGPGGAIVLSQRHARSFPLAAVPLSHLAPAISMARNS